MTHDIFSSPEWQLRARLDSFAFSLELLQSNYNELDILLTHFENPSSPQILALSEKWKRKEILKSLMFMLHNYLASARSLLDHCRVLHNQQYATANTFPEYKKEVELRFAADPLTQFVHGLREMAQHYRLPQMTSLTRYASGGVSIQVVLKKTDLMAYSSWKATARKYLMTVDAEHIALRVLCDTYHKKIIDFYNWFFAQLERIHASEFDRLHAVQRAELERNMPQVLSSLANQIVHAETARMSIRDILCTFLTPVEQRDLYEYERDPTVWLEKALPFVLERIPLEQDLIGQLRSLAAKAQSRAGAG